MCSRICSVVFVSLGYLFMSSTSCPAQGLIFSLPEDGTGIEYEGQIIQETVRSELEDGRETLTWNSELSIKSVGREDAEYNGKIQPCRWVEIKLVTGTAEASGIDAGPAGARIYKVLIPESKVIDTPVDAEAIPNTVLPIVQGFRRLGEEQVEPITSRGLVMYPTMCLLANYETPILVSRSESITNIAGIQSFDSRHMKGETVRERRNSRSTNIGEFWVSEDVPFGLVAWSVTVSRESKGSTEDRDKFRPVGSVKSDMRVRQIIRAAESELITE